MGGGGLLPGRFLIPPSRILGVITMTKHVCKYEMMYEQPNIDQNILISRCECGKEITKDAKAFFEEMQRKNTLVLFDFNSA